MTDTATITLGYWTLRTLRGAALARAHARRRLAKAHPFVPMVGRVDMNKLEAEQAEEAAAAITAALERQWPGRDEADTAVTEAKRAASRARRAQEDVLTR